MACSSQCDLFFLLPLLQIFMVLLCHVGFFVCFFFVFLLVYFVGFFINLIFPLLSNLLIFVRLNGIAMLRNVFLTSQAFSLQLA